MPNIQNKDSVITEEDFSGVVLAKQRNHVLYENAFGLSNRSEKINNEINTRFGVASGCKIFTAVAISQLVEKGHLTYETKLKDCLSIEFPNFHDGVTVHQLLTHTSGIPDYFDESVMEDFADLWKERPMYRIDSLKDFLPMFQQNEMMYTPGEKFQYNNAGYIVLGLIVEEISGLIFTDYVEKYIFAPCEMAYSGYFSLDSLPEKTATGYIDKEDGSWTTNVYSIPIKGGSDGGAFVTVGDMDKFWDALINNRLLSSELTSKLLTPHVEEEEGAYYGYGVWISKRDGEIYKYHVMGYDPGVSFHSGIYPRTGAIVTVASNKSFGAYDVIKHLEEAFQTL